MAPARTHTHTHTQCLRNPHPKELSSFRILVKHWWPDASPREFQKLERSLVKPFNSDDRDYYGNWWEWKGLKVDLKKFFAELKKLGKT